MYSKDYDVLINDLMARRRAIFDKAKEDAETLMHDVYALEAEQRREWEQATGLTIGDTYTASSELLNRLIEQTRLEVGVVWEYYLRFNLHRHGLHDPSEVFIESVKHPGAIVGGISIDVLKRCEKVVNNGR